MYLNGITQGKKHLAAMHGVSKHSKSLKKSYCTCIVLCCPRASKHNPSLQKKIRYKEDEYDSSATGQKEELKKREEEEN